MRVLRDEETFEFASTNDTVYDEDRKFIDAVVNDLPTEVPIAEGVKSLELSVAAVKSAETGKVMNLPL